MLERQTPNLDNADSVPAEVTPELLAASSSLEELIGLPFAISSFIDDAAERLREIMPLSVRHRKSIVKRFKGEASSADPRDETAFYDAFLGELEKYPGDFIFFDFAAQEVTSKAKHDKTPGPRMMRHVLARQDEHGDLIERFRAVATGDDRDEALFDLFLRHLGESVRLHLDHKDKAAGRYGTRSPDTRDDEDEKVRDAPEDRGDDLPKRPIPEEIAEHWTFLCGVLEEMAADMAEGLDASGLDGVLQIYGEMEELAKRADEYKDPRRAAAVSALQDSFQPSVHERLVEAVAKLSSDEAGDVSLLLGELRKKHEELEDLRLEIADLEGVIAEKYEAKSWTDMAALSAEMGKLQEQEREVEEHYTSCADSLEVYLDASIKDLGGFAFTPELTEPQAVEEGGDEPSGSLDDEGVEEEVAEDSDTQSEHEDGGNAEAEEPSSTVIPSTPVAVAGKARVADLRDNASTSAALKDDEEESSDEDNDLSLLKDIDEEDEVEPEDISEDIDDLPEGDPEAALCALISEDRIAIAARFAGAIEAAGHKSVIGADVLRAAAAGRLSFEAYDTGVQAFTTLANAASVVETGDAESEERRNLLLFGALLRPAILMPETQARQNLGDLNLRSYGPALAELQEAIQGLDYNFAPKVGDLAQAAGKPEVSRLDAVKQELMAWHEQAQMRSGPCQPSTYILNKIVSSGEIGEVVDRILEDRANMAAIDTVIERFKDRSAIETRAQEINKGAGTRSKGHFSQMSLQYMYRNIGEGIDLLMRYRDLAKVDHKRNSSEIEQVTRRITALKTKIATAQEAISSDLDKMDSQIDRALVEWVVRRMEDLSLMLDGQDIATSGTLFAALGDDLDLLPVGCQPLTPNSLRFEDGIHELIDREQMRAEDRRVLEAVMAGQIMSEEESFEEKIESGGFSAAERLIRRLASDVEARRALREKVATSRTRKLDSIELEVGEVSRKLKDLAKIDLKFQDQITREIDRLAEISLRIKEWRDARPAGDSGALVKAPLEVFQIPQIVAGAEKLIKDVEDAIKKDQIERLDQVAHDRKGMQREIEQLKQDIDTMSPEMVEDRLALIRDGRPIGEVRDRKPRPFDKFFPSFVEAGGAKGWPSSAEEYDLAFSSEDRDEVLRIAAERRTPAMDLLGAWFKVARQALSDVTRSTALSGFFEALTFNVDKVQEATRIPGVKQACQHSVRMSFQSKDFFCPPQFGSKADGRYNVVVIGPNVLFEQIDDHLEQDQPTILIVAERMSVEKRREFARGLRRRGVPAMLIDEMLTAYIAVSTTSRLETLFDCGLPFGKFEPYTTAAGRLPREMFFGREREIALIYRKEVDGCLVYGGRQLGKSALLSHVEERYHNPEKGIIVQRREVTSLGHRAEPASLVWSRIAQMLSDFGIVPSSETTEEGVTRHIRSWLKDDSSRRIILLLDETDRFMSSEARNGYPNLIPLKSLMEATHRNFKVVFAGLHNVRRMLSEPNSPLAHLGKPICIGPLNASHDDKASARRLMTDPMRAAGFTFKNEHAVENILAYVNTYPSLVQTFGKGLLEFLHRQGDVLGDGPLWKIPDSMIFKGEGFDEIRREIRSKFQLTLELDARYALIANVLGLIRTEVGEERVLRTGLSAAEIKEETMKHWPASIQTVDDAGFRVLLDELFELGILGRIEIEGSTQHLYILRTRQVAQMLGQEPDIIDALIQIQEREPEVDYDAPSYRRAYVPKNMSRSVDAMEMKRSPLSDSQISELLEPKRGGCRFITGLTVMGLREVPNALEQVLGPNRSWGKVEDVTVATVTNINNFRKEIETVKAGRGSKKVKLLFMRPNAEQIDELVSFSERWGQVKSGDVRPVFLLDASDDLLRDRAIARGAMALMPWSHEMLRVYLQEVEALNLDSRDIRKEILRVTGGIPSHICEIVKSFAGDHGRIMPESIGKAAAKIDAASYVPNKRLSSALSALENVDRVEDLQPMMELVASEGYGTADDVIPDLRMLGLVQAFDPVEGRLWLSAFGDLVKSALAKSLLTYKS